VISVAETTLLRRIPVPQPAGLLQSLFGPAAGSAPVGVLIEPTGRRAFVAHSAGDFLSVIDLERWERVATWKAGKGPDGMGWSALVVGA
jgi:DNA-binding beta-propeller fold protein YncE